MPNRLRARVPNGSISSRTRTLGSCGSSRSSRGISSRNGSSLGSAGARRYLGGVSARSARRTVLRLAAGPPRDLLDRDAPTPNDQHAGHRGVNIQRAPSAATGLASGRLNGGSMRPKSYEKRRNLTPRCVPAVSCVAAASRKTFRLELLSRRSRARCLGRALALCAARARGPGSGLRGAARRATKLSFAEP
jgi:hypothetical protein